MLPKPPGMPHKTWKELLYSQGKVDHEEAVREINKRWKKPRLCPVCGQENWAVSRDLFRLWAMHLKNASPCVNLCCQHCGYTMLFNAEVLKLLPDGKR